MAVAPEGPPLLLIHFTLCLRVGCASSRYISYRNDTSVSNIRKTSPNIMLGDPLVLPVPTPAFDSIDAELCDKLGLTAETHTVELHTVPSTPGVSKRKGTLGDGTKVLLTTSHSLSKENKPYDTDRTLIRLDFSRVDSITGKPVTLAVYCVVALPQGATFSQTYAELYTKWLALFLLQGGRKEGATTPRFCDATEGITLGRLIGGEA